MIFVTFDVSYGLFWWKQSWMNKWLKKFHISESFTVVAYWTRANKACFITCYKYSSAKRIISSGRGALLASCSTRGELQDHADDIKGSKWNGAWIYFRSNPTFVPVTCRSLRSSSGLHWVVWRKIVASGAAHLLYNICQAHFLDTFKFQLKIYLFQQHFLHWSWCWAISIFLFNECGNNIFVIIMCRQIIYLYLYCLQPLKPCF